MARTSAAPGKTRLANLYRVRRGANPALYLVDLPGYGYARGDRGELESVAREYFLGREEQDRRERRDHAPAHPARPASPGLRSALLLVDARHPGLPSDRDAWRWLTAAADRAAVVATKIDKLSRSERQRAIKTNEAVFAIPVLPVSAATGEGLDELWKLIDRLTKPE